MGMTEVHTARTDDRIATITRAIEHMERYGPRSLYVRTLLAQTGCHEYMVAEPDFLIHQLRRAMYQGYIYPAWAVARDFCKLARIEN